jgi:Heterokaryon incompatibility protein (HET)/Nucleoside 2-deoxyribosyltransferase like
MKSIQSSNNLSMSAYLDSKYPTLEDKQQVKEIIVEWISPDWLESHNFSDTIAREQAEELTGGELDLTAYSQLEVVAINGRCLKTPLTSLNVNRCIHLKVLEVYRNKLTELDLSQNLKLEELHLPSNNFSARDISFLGHLVNLKLLSLSNSDQDRINQNIYNRFHGSLESLKCLTKLEELSINNTDLNSGAEYLPNSLKKISCSSKERPESQVQELENSLKSLNDFIVNSNVCLRKFSPQVWLDRKYPNKETTTEIDFSDLGGGNIEGELIISDFPNLKTIGSEHFLNYFWLFNSFVIKITKVTIKDCPLLKKLDLNYFYENKALIISNCPQLSIIDCSSNDLVNLEIQENPSLKKVIIDNNNNSLQVSDFLKSNYWVFLAGKYLKKKNAQEWLDLTYPKSERENCASLEIDDFLEGSLKLEGFINLEILHFLGNKNLTSLDLSDCQNLWSLNCSRINLTDISFLQTIPQPTKLTYLDISNNNFKEQDLTFLTSFTNLERLLLGSWDNDKLAKKIYNRFTGSLEHLKGMSKLLGLDISNTDLDSGLEFLPVSLEEVDYFIDKNLAVNVKKIEESLGSFLTKQKLNRMYPDKNEKKIDNLWSENLRGHLDLSEYENLEELKCFNNYLTSLNIGKCLKLKKIICHDNELKKINIETNLYLKVLDIRDNDFKEGNIVNNLYGTTMKLLLPETLQELYLGNINEERVKEGKYNRFNGTLRHLENLTKLEYLDISNTDIDEGWDSLPKNLKKVTFSKEILKVNYSKENGKRQEVFRVNLIKRFIENRFNVKKVANLPTFYHFQREEPEYYISDTLKWGLEEKLKKPKEREEVYQKIQPNEDIIGEIKSFKDERVALPTKLLQIDELKIVETKELKSATHYAIISYSWGKEPEKEKHQFFFSEEQYEKYKLKDNAGKEIAKEEVEKKSPAFAKTLMKAIEACRLLEIEYLWMDQLCVDQHNAIEKSNEVNQMGKYYGNAAVTLVAIHKNLSERKVDKLDPILAIEKIINSEWFQRSWTFQEGWLSKRTLFMFDDMLVDGSYLAQVWAYNQATDVEGKYSSRQEFEDKAVKIATPIGWARYKEAYKPEDTLTFRLHEVLRGVRGRKKSFPIDGIYSILGLLPYRVKPQYKGKDFNYDDQYLKNELLRVMREAADEGYLEHLSWHGPGGSWIPKIDKTGSIEIWGGMDIDCRNWEKIVETKDESLSLTLKKSNKYIIKGQTTAITKIGGDSIIGGVFSGTIKLEAKKELKIWGKELKIWGTEEVLESIKKDDFLVIPNKHELQSDMPFGILVRKEENESNEKIFYCSRIGLVELKKEDKEDLEKHNETSNEEITIKLNSQLKTSGIKQSNSSKNEKKVFLGGTCNGSVWRKELTSQLKIGYFDPVVDADKWNEAAQETEIRQRGACDFLLYVITKETKGSYSIAEVVEDSNKRPKQTIFCYLEEGFDNDQIKSFKSISRLVKWNGAQVFTSLKEVADYLNSQQLEIANADSEKEEKEVLNNQESYSSAILAN